MNKKQLSQTSNVVWYCALRKLRAWIEDEKNDDEYYRPWMLVVISSPSGFILSSKLFSKQPTPKELLECLLDLMGQPIDSGLKMPPPKEIHFDDKRLADSLSPTLLVNHIAVKYKPNHHLSADIFKEFTLKISPKETQIPGLLTQPKVTRKMVAMLFEAACIYYRSRPWDFIGDESLLVIKVGDQPTSYYANVLGCQGVEYGLGVYTNWEQVEKFYSMAKSGEVDKNQEHHLFSFCSPPYVSFDDLDAIEKYGWEMPAPNLFPTPFFFTRKAVKRPNADMLCWYEAALRAIPLFVSQNKQQDVLNQVPWKGISELEVETSRGIQKVQINFYYAELPIIPILNDLTTDEDLSDQISFDRRGMEGDIAQLGFSGWDEDPSNDSVVRAAQSIMYDAWDTPDLKTRIRLAKEALKVSPDCADAYVLLAEEEAQTVQKSKTLFQQGVEAGRRALGEDFFQDEENVGHFWGILHTRPYMRALAGLANTLWQMGNRDQAMLNYRELLRLNPGDNQGIRYVLLELLLEMNQLEDVRALMDEYPDCGSVDWAYTALLMELMENGDSTRAHSLLESALETNDHVPAYLLGIKRIPDLRPPYITLGGEDEAADYASRHFRIWKKTKAALKWIKDNRANA
ncbi:MAG: tetratricopeptide repeat protein [Pelolinea sp.]|nr:tetratricopeptide repeat protein [Pelolinea sp.]